MAILCSLKNLSLSFGGKFLFQQADLTINEFDRIGLLGLNGAGKSSLFKIINEQVKPDHSTPPFEYHKSKGKPFNVMLIPQDFPLNGLELQLKDAYKLFFPEIYQWMQVHDVDKLEHAGGYELVGQIESFFRLFDLNDFDKKISDMSGGEQKKILLSMGLASKHSLILWDEPTNHLDIESIELFEEELALIQNTFIIISHDRFLLNRLTNRIVSITQAKIDPFEGSYGEYLEHLESKESERVARLSRLKNTLRRETDWMRQGVKARGTKSKKRQENFHELAGKVSDLRSQAKRNIEIQIESTKRKTKKISELKDVSFSYSDKIIFKNLNLSLHQGDKIGIMGKNGVGKSTLLNLIAQKLKPTTGEMQNADNLVIQYFTQKREELDLDKTPYDIAGDGIDFINLPNDQRIHVTSYLEQFLFNKEDIKRPIRSFSGGERNRLQMALNFKKPGDLWIFDEPTNDLDLETLNILEQKFAEYKGTLILISHDRAFLSQATNKIWYLHDQGVEMFEAGYEQVGPYLELLRSEEELREMNAKASQVTATAPKKEEVVKLSNKDKMRLKTIDQDIEQAEIRLAKIADLIENFDFNNMTKELNKEFEKLGTEQTELESKLLELYEVKETLNG